MSETNTPSVRSCATCQYEDSHVNGPRCEACDSEYSGWAPVASPSNPLPPVVMATPDRKECNPKEAAGDKKVPLAFVSPIAKAYWAAAQALGLIKYGAWNWRIAGTRASTYISAMQRHIDAWSCGEEFDPVDGTHHLGNVMACAAILIEARAIGKLTDDRGPAVDLRTTYAEVEAQLASIRVRYADSAPRHYTIADTQAAGAGQ